MTPLADDPKMVEVVKPWIGMPAYGHSTQHIALAILRDIQPHIDALVREAQARAWDEGWQAGVRNAASPYAGDGAALKARADG